MAKVRLQIFPNTQILKTFLHSFITSLHLIFSNFRRYNLFRILPRLPPRIFRERLQAWFTEPTPINTIFNLANVIEPLPSFLDLMKVRVRAEVPFLYKAIQIMFIDQLITFFFFPTLLHTPPPLLHPAVYVPQQSSLGRILDISLFGVPFPRPQFRLQTDPEPPSTPKRVPIRKRLSGPYGVVVTVANVRVVAIGCSATLRFTLDIVQV